MKQEDMEIANKTARSLGAVGKNSLVPQILRAKYPIDQQSSDFTVLDFGSGPNARHTKELRKYGYICHAYEMGDNYSSKVHISDDLMRGMHFDVIMVSNVINTLSSLDAVFETLNKIYSLASEYTEIILNYPKSPRKCDLLCEDFLSVLLRNRFKNINTDSLTKKGVYYCTQKQARIFQDGEYK